MNAKEYLKQIWWIDKEIKYRQDQADMIRARAEGRSSPQVTDMPKGGHKTDTAGLIVRLAELDKYIKEQTDRLISLKASVIKEIDKLPDQRSRLILVCRYLQVRKWEDIENEYNYEHSYMMSLHRKALREFEEANPHIKQIRQRNHKKPH